MVASDRGQVLLLGGLALAIVFLTAIPLSNSLVVTESASTSETVIAMDRAADREASVERGVRALLAQTNTSNASAVNESLRDFSTYYTDVSGQQDGVYVNGTVNVSASGAAFDRAKLSRPGTNGNAPWQPVDKTTRVSEFTVTVEDALPPTNPFTVTISNDSGTVYELEGWRLGTVVTVRTDNGSSVRTCQDSRPTALRVDVLAGTCSYDVTTEQMASFSPTDGPYTIEFEDGGGRTEGGFAFVGAGDFYPGQETTVVSPAVDLTYVGPDASYERTILVNETS